MIVKPSMFIKILTKCILKVLSCVLFKLIILLYLRNGKMSDIIRKFQISQVD